MAKKLVKGKKKQTNDSVTKTIVKSSKVQSQKMSKNVKIKKINKKENKKI